MTPQQVIAHLQALNNEDYARMRRIDQEIEMRRDVMTHMGEYIALLADRDRLREACKAAEAYIRETACPCGPDDLLGQLRSALAASEGGA